MADSTQSFEPQLLKESEAARWLNIGKRKLWSLRASGAIPIVRIGRSVRFDVDDLRDYVAKNKVGIADA
ncbi:helix-turn-helix domain-containing protein [Rubripirellula obstinata]|uniref:helix-turn-helix domain-containing protein n=1 Tax=Rubripirellula obstinata TaxID=406547 RepID=UPI0008308566|nr:helix-turn-helix domain-containing protein [Rubripirellula obstinata]